MPPNLGGFFMVRSYYPSECHADYFDFERIEALKPAIEACGISRSEERFSRNAETDLVCRLLLEKKKNIKSHRGNPRRRNYNRLRWGEPARPRSQSCASTRVTSPRRCISTI